MYEDIRKNKIKSGIIVFGFVVMITLILYYVCMAFDLGYFSIVIALTFSIISAWASYYYSDKIVLSINRARPATEQEYKKLNNILDAILVSSGLKDRPRLYVMDEAQPNAFATGRDPKNAVICVTTGLLEKMDYYELEGVVAHELAHIKNYDIRLSAIVTVMVGLVVILADVFSRAMFFGRRSSSDNKNSGNAILMLIGLVFLILSPIFSKIMQLAISRRREYLADATAIEFTRNPDGLINALRKLDNDPDEIESANSSTAHMYFASPLKSKKKKSSLFSTHPPISERITALENLR